MNFLKNLLRINSAKNNNVLLLILLLGIIVRIIVVNYFINDGFVWPDEKNQYYPQAVSIYQGNGWGNNTKIMPLFPFFIASLFYISNENILFTRILLTIINSSLILIVYLIAKQLFNKKIALLSALTISFYPIIIFSSGLLVPEIFFTILICTGILFFIRIKQNFHNIWLASLFFGLASLTISLTMLFLFFSIFILFYTLRKLSVKQRFYSIIIYSAIITSIIGSWGFRNYLVTGHFSILKTNLGEVLYFHNNQNASGFDRRGNSNILENLPEDLELRLRSKNKIDSSKIYISEVKQFIINNPFHFIRLCIERFFNLWRFYPSTISKSNFLDYKFILISILTYGPIFIFSIIGFLVAVKNWESHLVIYGFLFSLIIIFTIIRSSMRARLPMEPFLVIYSSLGIFYFISYIRNRWELFKKKNSDVI